MVWELCEYAKISHHLVNMSVPEMEFVSLNCSRKCGHSVVMCLTVSMVCPRQSVRAIYTYLCYSWDVSVEEKVAEADVAGEDLVKYG